MEWYYTRDGENVGPFSNEEAKEMIVAGTLTADSMVWNESLTEWIKLAASDLAEHLHVNTKKCSICGNHFASDSLIEIGDMDSCAECKPVALKRLQGGTSVATSFVYATVGTRFLGSILDSLLLYAVNFISGRLLGMINLNPFAVLGIGYLVAFLYPTIMLYKYGATLGMMAVKIRIVNADGTPISYAKSVGRFFASILSSLIFCIGYFMAIWDKETRTLHDMICNTRVIKKNQ